jgi:hypothetical protein
MDDELLYFAAVQHTLVAEWSPTSRDPQLTKISLQQKKDPADLVICPGSAGLVLVGTTGFEPATP